MEKQRKVKRLILIWSVSISKNPFRFLGLFSAGYDNHRLGSSEEVYREGGDAGFKKNPVGCGPYRFVEFVRA